MDINHRDFQSHFPTILQTILLSRFISMDLELSGIPSRHSNQSSARPSDYRKQTLQQRYAETKAAAEKYQVFQLGLTCVEEDLKRGCYVLRTYNFNLQPVPDQSLHVGRDITIQSSALDFLRRQGFRIEDSVYAGVPYLSREEEIKARAMEISKRDRSNLNTIVLRPEDWEAQEFLDGVRQQVLNKFRRAMDVCNLYSMLLAADSPHSTTRSVT